MGIELIRSDLAIMSIFRHRQVPAFGRLEIAEIRGCWARYALRGRDLDRGVMHLESLGLVEVDRVRGRQYVVLTDQGFRSANSVIGWVESVLLLPRRLVRWLGGLRAGKVAEAAQRRRAVDRIETDG